MFGEIVHDEPEDDLVVATTEDDLLILNERSQGVRRPVNFTAPTREVSELLFHPANFKSLDESDENDAEEEQIDMKRVTSNRNSLFLIQTALKENIHTLTA